MDRTKFNQLPRYDDVNKTPASNTTFGFRDRSDRDNPRYLWRYVTSFFYEKKAEANSSSGNSRKPVLDRNAVPCGESQSIFPIPDKSSFGKISAEEAFKELSKIAGSANNWELYAKFLKISDTEINKLKLQIISNNEKLSIVLQKAPVLTFTTLKSTIEVVAHKTKKECSFDHNPKNDILSPFTAFLFYSKEGSNYFFNDIYTNNQCLLAAALRLPRSDRLVLQPLLLKGDFEAYIAECFLKAAGRDQLTYVNLLSALKVISYSYPNWTKDFCNKNGLKLDDGPKYLPDYQVIFNDRIKALSQPLSFRDVIYFAKFTGSCQIAWALGCDDILQEIISELAIQKKDWTEKDLYRSDITRYLLLEKIFEKKKYITANEVTRILFDDFRMALSMVDQLTGCHHQLSNLSYADTTNIYKMLYRLEYEEIKKFAEALGLHRSDIERMQLIPGSDLILNIERLASERGLETPGNIVFALGEISLNPELSTTIRSLPCLKGVASCKLVPWQILNQCLNKSVMPVGSVPITMEILHDLPLREDWYLICILLGLEMDNEVLDHLKLTSDLACYHLARKLSEPHRQLETGHLYLALDYLDDEYALSLFPEHLKCKPKYQSENNRRHFLWGQKLISMAKELVKELFKNNRCKEDILINAKKIVKKLGLKSDVWHVSNLIFGFADHPIISIILMMFFSYKEYSLEFIAPFIDEYGKVGDVQIFEDRTGPLVKQNVKQYIEPTEEIVASKGIALHRKHNFLRRRKQGEGSMNQTNCNCEKNVPILEDDKTK